MVDAVATPEATPAPAAPRAPAPTGGSSITDGGELFGVPQPENQIKTVDTNPQPGGINIQELKALELANQAKIAADGIPPKTAENAENALKVLALPAAGESSNPYNTLTPEVQPQEVVERVTGQPVPEGVRDMVHYTRMLEDAEQRYKLTFDINEFNKQYTEQYINTSQAASGSESQQEINITIPPRVENINGRDIPIPPGVSNADLPFYANAYTSYVHSHPDVAEAMIDLELIKEIMRQEKINRVMRVQQSGTGLPNADESNQEEQQPIILGPAPQEKKKEPVKPEDELPEDQKTEETPNGEKKQEQQLTEEEKTALMEEAKEAVKEDKEVAEAFQSIIVQANELRYAEKVHRLYGLNDLEIQQEFGEITNRIDVLEAKSGNAELTTQEKQELNELKTYKKEVEKAKKLPEDKRKAEQEGKKAVADEIQKNLNQTIQNLRVKGVSEQLITELQREVSRIPGLDDIIKHGITAQSLKESGLGILGAIIEAIGQAMRAAGKELVNTR